jgi:cobalt/nickel transport system ATP-binding protein
VQADAVIVAQGLTYTYPRGPLALDHVTFQVPSGECVGLVGPNGAGKTTLFLGLSGVLTLRPGMARLANLDPANPSERRLLPTQVGIVFQNSDDQLFNSTVFDDVAFGPLNLGLAPEETRARVAEALVQVGLSGLEARVPHHLSGGEKRRVALAGVLAMRPEVLLLDEPTQFLDPRGRREFIHLLKGLAGTKMIAAHDLEMILQTCSRVLLLDRGRLIADGPARTILANPALMEAHGLEVPHTLANEGGTFPESK